MKQQRSKHDNFPWLKIFSIYASATIAIFLVLGPIIVGFKTSFDWEEMKSLLPYVKPHWYWMFMLLVPVIAGLITLQSWLEYKKSINEND